jgi:hypothetical protein
MLVTIKKFYLTIKINIKMQETRRLTFGEPEVTAIKTLCAAVIVIDELNKVTIGLTEPNKNDVSLADSSSELIFDEYGGAKAKVPENMGIDFIKNKTKEYKEIMTKTNPFNIYLEPQNSKKTFYSPTAYFVSEDYSYIHFKASIITVSQK